MYIGHVRNTDEFELFGTVLGYNDDGKGCIFVNYKLEKDNVVYKLEGYTENDDLNVHRKITYGAFKRKFPKHRIYVQGYAEC